MLPAISAPSERSEPSLLEKSQFWLALQPDAFLRPAPARPDRTAGVQILTQLDLDLRPVEPRPAWEDRLALPRLWWPAARRASGRSRPD